MPFPAILLIIAALLPLVSCLVLLYLGRRLGTPLAGYVSIFLIALAFLCSGWATMRWVLGENYNGVQYGQGASALILVSASGIWQFGVVIDSLTVSLFLTLTLCAMLVHIFVTRSMRREARLIRFFTVLSLACFSVLGLLLCSSLLHQVLFLELSSLCSSMLVGFRFDRELTVRAAARMFIIDRVGDIALIFGIGILFACVQTLSWPQLWAALADAGHEGAVALAGGSIISQRALTVAGAAIFIGIAPRLVQFPFHIWANDVAEGVAPAAGIVLVVTQAAAGVFMLARLFPILTPSARLFIAIVGATTLVAASLIACAQGGIKQVLTWLGASQLGLMVLALGIGSWSGAIFHLVSYCFFQILLFLAAGAVIRAARGEIQLLRYGGLAGRMPATAIFSAVAILASCGIGAAGLGLSGYYSRLSILEDAAAFGTAASAGHRSGFYWLLFALPVFGTFLTAFALTRWWLLIFSGRSRDHRLHDHAREAPTLLWPMLILVVMAALAGKWLGVPDLINSAVGEVKQSVSQWAGLGRSNHLFDAARRGEEETTASELPAGASTAVVPTRDRGLASRWLAISLACGFLFAMLIYLRGPEFAAILVKRPPFRWLHVWLANRMFFDELYDAIFVTVTAGLAGLLAWTEDNMVRALARLLLRV